VAEEAPLLLLVDKGPGFVRLSRDPELTFTSLRRRLTEGPETRETFPVLFALPRTARSVFRLVNFLVLIGPLGLRVSQAAYSYWGDG
jgi:hypothetical protein